MTNEEFLEGEVVWVSAADRDRWGCYEDRVVRDAKGVHWYATVFVPVQDDGRAEVCDNLTFAESYEVTETRWRPYRVPEVGVEGVEKAEDSKVVR